MAINFPWNTNGSINCSTSSSSSSRRISTYCADCNSTQAIWSIATKESEYLKWKKKATNGWAATTAKTFYLAILVSFLSAPLPSTRLSCVLRFLRRKHFVCCQWQPATEFVSKWCLLVQNVSAVWVLRFILIFFILSGFGVNTREEVKVLWSLSERMKKMATEVV